MFIAGTNPPIFRISGGSPATGVTDSMNLFIRGTQPPSLTATVPLTIRGTTSGVGGVTKTMPLTITGSPFTNVMNLFIEGHDRGATSWLMNLFIQGGNPTAYGSTPLFIQNNNGGLTKRVPLFIRGTGVNDGYTPIGEDMNLFICRGPNAGITLFICNTANTNTAPLFISGSIPFHTKSYEVEHNSAIYGVSRFNTRRFGPSINANSLSPTLFIEGAGGISDETLTLFINGNVPTQTTGNVNLVIPVVYGANTKTLTLYINGFNY